MRVGTDVIDVGRVKKSLEIKGFMEKVYSPAELEFLKRPESFAGNFAAKEAFSKALGTGVRGFSLNEVSVLRDSLGAPYLELSGKAGEAAKGLSFTVSISHTKDTAVAVVIAYGENDGKNI